MKSTLVVMATGTGKTVVMADLVRRWRKGRVMMIAHREELITQGADKFSRLCGEQVGVEMADSVVREWHADRPRIVVASVQTLNAGNKSPRYEKFRPEEFGLILTDEAHRATAASYRRIYNWFSQNPECRHLGVTATPDRTDQRALGTVFDSVAFKYDILSAISEGWLVPVKQEFVQVDGLDLSKCHANRIDLKDKDVAEVMERYENLYAVCDATRRLAAGRKTIIFAASVEHSHRMAAILNGYEEGTAAAIDGKTDKDLRRNILKRFAMGELRYVVNMGCLTEGFDDPGIEVVAMARPTKSRLMYAQMLGRGTRVLEGLVDHLSDPIARQSAIAGSAKPFCTVLDFVGNSGKHKLVCSADILGGEEPPEVTERLRRNAKARQKPADMMEELEIARKEIAEEKRQAEERRLTPEARFHSQSVDPFNHYDIVHSRELGEGNSDYAYLEKQGVNKKWLQRATRDQLTAVVRQVKHRHAKGLCSVKQCNVLRRAGINGQTLTKRQAGELLDPIFKNNFRPTAEVLEKARRWGVLLTK